VTLETPSAFSPESVSRRQNPPLVVFLCLFSRPSFLELIQVRQVTHEQIFTISGANFYRLEAQLTVSRTALKRNRRQCSTCEM